MANDDVKDEAAKPEAAPSEEQQAAERRPLEWDDSGVQSLYTNLCRVTGTPEEVVLDFALHSSPMGQIVEPIRATQRLVMSFYTAKRLLGALHMTVQRHEQAFGVLEVDVRKRARMPEGPAQ